MRVLFCLTITPIATGQLLLAKTFGLGMNVIILPGAEIGDGAIIGAGSVVAGKVEAMSVVWGYF